MEKTEFGIACGYDTTYFDNEQQAQWFYLMTLGQGLRPFAFKKIGNKVAKLEWNKKILNHKNAPFKIEYGVVSLKFYKENEAISKYDNLKKHGINIEFLININGFDFVTHEPDKIYTNSPKEEF